jgi:hypothetical protein
LDANTSDRGRTRTCNRWIQVQVCNEWEL